MRIVHARGLKVADSSGSSDPYAVVIFPNKKEKET